MILIPNNTELPYICQVCGTVFYAVPGRHKYCPDCKKAAYEQKKAEYRKATNYYEKQKDRKLQERNAQIQEQLHQAEEARKKRDQSEKRKNAYRKRKLVKLAESGDLYAKRTLALAEGRMKDYWLLLRDIVLYEDSKSGHKSLVMVGGIDVTDPEYELYILNEFE